MGQITSLFVYKVARQASPGIETADLFAALGLAPDGPIDPARMVTSPEYYAFFAELARRDPQGLTLPLRTGATMVSDEYGAFGLAWKSAPNLRGSYARLERYARVLTSVSTYQVEPTEDGAFMHLHRAGERILGMRLSNEATIASVTAMSKQVATQPFRPLAVYFKHDTPGTAEAHETHFGCPVYFGSDRDALLISKETLSTQNRLGDESIAAFFDRHLQTELESFDDEAALETRVRRSVAQALSEGVPPLSLIAGDLGMSARTLQRRLSDQGQSFQNLVDLARSELSQELLRDTNYNLAEIAFLTGFSEQSAFTRAFKRWAGQTPRSYRLSVLK